MDFNEWLAYQDEYVLSLPIVYQQDMYQDEEGVLLNVTLWEFNEE